MACHLPGDIGSEEDEDDQEEEELTTDGKPKIKRPKNRKLCEFTCWSKKVKLIDTEENGENLQHVLCRVLVFVKSGMHKKCTTVAKLTGCALMKDWQGKSSMIFGSTCFIFQL